MRQHLLGGRIAKGISKFGEPIVCWVTAPSNFFGVVPKWETGVWDFCGVTVLLNASRSGLRDLFRGSAFLCSLVGHDLGVGEHVPGR